MDTRFYQGENVGAPDSLDLRRARIDLQGAVHRWFTFRIQTELADQPGVQNAWLDAGPLMLSDNGGHTHDFTIYADANSPLANRPAFSDASSGYTATQLDLSPFAGQKVRVRFRLGADECCTARGWFIDDVRLYQCVDAGVPTLRVADVTVREGDAGTKNAVFTVSLSAPVGGIVSVDYATIWFAVLLTINLEVGLITPPVGLNLYVLRGVAPDIPLGVVLEGRYPTCSSCSASWCCSASSRASRPGCPTC